MSVIFHGSCAIERGQMECDRIALRGALRSYSGPAELIIRKPTRDSRHNRLLHAVVGEIADHLGWEADEFKEFIVTKLRPLETDETTGWVRRQKTRAMSDEQIRDLVTEIQAWAGRELGFVPRGEAA